jgi:hypothetical protein
LHKILQAQITGSETFRSIVAEVYRHAHGERAAAVIVVADGARWIWSMVEDLLPHAVLNLLLTLRCIFLEQSWQTYWDSQALLAA